VLLQEAFTSVTIPDGGTALLGGFRDIQEKWFKSSVPFLDSIPLLNALARRKGEVRETSSLMILLKAQMISVREEEKKRFNTD
jgi:type II secretory pathway component GspD/PulD (secretin)